MRSITNSFRIFIPHPRMGDFFILLLEREKHLIQWKKEKRCSDGRKEREKEKK